MRFLLLLLGLFFSCSNAESVQSLGGVTGQKQNSIDSKRISEEEIDIIEKEDIDISKLVALTQGDDYLSFQDETYWEVEGNDKYLGLGKIILFESVDNPVYYLSYPDTIDINSQAFFIEEKSIILEILAEELEVKQKRRIYQKFIITNLDVANLLRKYYHTSKYAPELLEGPYIPYFDTISASEVRVTAIE